MQEHFSASNDRYYQPAKLHEVRTLLTKILKDPERTHDHVKRCVVLSIFEGVLGCLSLPRTVSPDPRSCESRTGRVMRPV